VGREKFRSGPVLEAGTEGVQLNGREAVGEAAEDVRHAGGQRLKESDESGVFPSVLKAYLEERTAVVWDVGWRLVKVHVST